MSIFDANAADRVVRCTVRYYFDEMHQVLRISVSDGFDRITPLTLDRRTLQRHFMASALAQEAVRQVGRSIRLAAQRAVALARGNE